MRRKILPALAVLLAATLWFLSSRAEPEPFLPAELVCLVDTPTGTGSATPFTVTPEGFTVLLTARHVVEGLARPGDLTVSLRRALPVPAVRIEQCPELDVALIWVQGIWPTVRLDAREPRFGDLVQGAGYFYGGPLLVSDGIVSEKDVASVESFPGCSGGAIFRDGLLVGVVHSSGRVNVLGGADQVAVGVPTLFTSIFEALPWIRGSL